LYLLIVTSICNEVTAFCKCKPYGYNATIMIMDITIESPVGEHINIESYIQELLLDDGPVRSRHVAVYTV
jgi:hypothetical protein